MPHPRLAALARVPILGGLDDAGLERLAAVCAWRRFAAGERIVGYLEPSTAVYFLISGRARAMIYSAGGRAVVFDGLDPGTVFGELAALDGAPRSADIEAVEDSTVATLSGAEFERLLLAEPSIAVAMLRKLAADVRRLSERVHEFSTLAVQNRIQAELLRLIRAPGHGGEHPALLSPAPSLADIADRISTRPEAVSREISRLTGIGLVLREGGDLRVLDVGRLEELVREAKGE